MFNSGHYFAGEEAKIVIPTVLCFLLLVFVAVIIIIVAYIYKRGKRERQSDEGSIGGPPDGDSQVPPPRPVATTPIVPQVSDAESQGPPVVTDEPVTVVTGSGRSPRHQRVSSLLRYPGENIGCSMMDPVDLPAVGTTTPTYLRPQSNSFSVEPGQDERCGIYAQLVINS